jgi:hypothetical protein
MPIVVAVVTNRTVVPVVQAEGQGRTEYRRSNVVTVIAAVAPVVTSPGAMIPAVVTPAVVIPAMTSLITPFPVVTTMLLGCVVPAVLAQVLLVMPAAFNAVDIVVPAHLEIVLLVTVLPLVMPLALVWRPHGHRRTPGDHEGEKTGTELFHGVNLRLLPFAVPTLRRAP